MPYVHVTGLKAKIPHHLKVGLVPMCNVLKLKTDLIRKGILNVSEGQYSAFSKSRQPPNHQTLTTAGNSPNLSSTLTPAGNSSNLFKLTLTGNFCAFIGLIKFNCK